MIAPSWDSLRLFLHVLAATVWLAALSSGCCWPAEPVLGRYLPALAAAFCPCLYSRTFFSDSASMTSATERNEPDSP